jgi:hypothetical protein
MNDMPTFHSTLSEVSRIRERTSDELLLGWIPLFVFGAAVLGSGVFTLLDDEHLGTYWLIAAPIATLITIGGVRRVELDRGVVDRNELFYATVIVTMTAAAIVLGYSLDNLASDVGPAFPIGLGLLAIGAFDRSTLLMVAGGLILVLATAVAIVGPDNADTWIAFGEGLILIGAGALARPRRVTPLSSGAAPIGRAS